MRVHMGFPKRPTAPSGSRARAHARGAVMVEYALLLVFVFIPFFIGVTTGGRQMLQDYREGRAQMMRNIP